MKPLRRAIAAPSLRPANERLLRDLELFVVATPDHLPHLELAPFGLSIAPDAVFDPLTTSAAPLLDRLARLDALTFGPEGMPMARWLFLDAAALPGAIVGFARRAGALDERARALLGVPGDLADPRAVVPFAMYIAVPGHTPGDWIGHNLASVAERFPDHDLAGLGRLTKAVALAVYRARAQIGATQWASRALHVHARLGPLELRSAWTPAHLDPATLTYRATIDDAALRHLAGDPDGHVDEPPPDEWIDSADNAAMIALEARIEAGERLCIAGPPITVAPGRQRIPLSRRPSP